VVLAVSADGVGIVQTAWTVTIKRRGPPDVPVPPKPNPVPPDTTPPDTAPPDTNPPQTPPNSGFGLASQVPGWLSTVPPEHKANGTRISEGMVAIANISGPPILPNVSDVKTALLASLTLSIDNKKAWSEFGRSLAKELRRLQDDGTISTAKQFGAAILEVAEAMQ
jgi:hypothetical protein